MEEYVRVLSLLHPSGLEAYRGNV